MSAHEDEQKEQGLLFKCKGVDVKGGVMGGSKSMFVDIFFCNFLHFCFYLINGLSEYYIYFIMHNT